MHSRCRRCAFIGRDITNVRVAALLAVEVDGACDQSKALVA